MAIKMKIKNIKLIQNRTGEAEKLGDKVLCIRM